MSDTSDMIGLATGVIVAGAVLGAVDRMGRRSYPRRGKRRRRSYDYDLLGRRIWVPADSAGLGSLELLQPAGDVRLEVKTRE